MNAPGIRPRLPPARKTTRVFVSVAEHELPRFLGSKQKSEFVYDLREHIEQRLDRQFFNGGNTP